MKSFPLITMYLIICSSTFAQPVKEPKFSSPNAASLGRFNDIPVSYHTGVPQISIPIFTVEDGSLAVPISLNYHSSGVKVDDVASWVGLGWNLSAAGSITRTIIGGPDEGKKNTYLPNSNCGLTGWYKDYGMPDCMVLNVGGCGSINPADGRGSGLETSCYAKYRAASEGNIDSEPDIYSFSFPGHSGKFFFDANRKMHMVPESDYFIVPIEGQSGLFHTWKVLAPDGTKYFFGGSLATENNHVVSSQLPYDPNEDNRVSTTWYLTRIESMNGENWINFEYESENYSYGTKASQTYVRSIGQSSGSYLETSGLSVTNVISWRLSKIVTSADYVRVEFIEKVNPREDVSAFKRVFEPNIDSRSLEKIKITYGDKCKYFNLQTDYFQSDRSMVFNVSPETPYDAKRLRLNSVQETTCDGTITLPPYVLTYNTQIPMPRRYSTAQDHWGYHNGKSANTTLIPPFIDPFSMQQRPGADRDPVEDQMFCGILIKMDYPTGGSSEYVYEAHRESPTSTTVIGGVRIKSIITKDGLGNPSTRNFNYLQGTLYQGGLAYMKDRSWNQTIYMPNLYDFGIEFSSSPDVPLQSSHGYHIGYSIIEVVTPGNGKTTYSYYNSHPISPSLYYPRTTMMASIGTTELFQEQVFDEAGILKKVATYYYSSGPELIVPARKVVSINCLNDPPPGGGTDYRLCGTPYPLYTDYYVITRRHNLTQTIETIDGFTTTTNYTYPVDKKDNYARKVEFLNSDGLIQSKETVFPSDAGSTAPAAMWSPADPQFKNLISASIEEKSFVNNVLKGKVANQYTQAGSSILVNSVRKYPSGTSEFVEDQFQYDLNTNLTGVVKSSGLNTAFLWGYKNQLPIATVENTVFQSSTIFQTATFSTSVSSNTTSCTPLAGTLVIAEAQTISITPTVFLNGGISLWIKLSLKNSSGAVVYGPRLYDTNGTYPDNIYLAPGNYNFCYESGNYSSPFNGYSNINVNVSYTNGKRANIVHTSFEDEGVTALSHTGSKVWNGLFTLNMPHIIGDYVLSYWKRINTGDNYPWVLVEELLSVNSGSPALYKIGESGYYLDDVRLHPKGAMMTTYTYNPGLGISSSTDPNNRSSFYEYDGLGRLLRIKDDNQSIVKSYQYHIKGQN